MSRQPNSLPDPSKPAGTSHRVRVTSPAWPRTMVIYTDDEHGGFHDEAKWNVPALTHRDANAATVMDFLNSGQAAFMSPPKVNGPRQ